MASCGIHEGSLWCMHGLSHCAVQPLKRAKYDLVDLERISASLYSAYLSPYITWMPVGSYKSGWCSLNLQLLNAWAYTLWTSQRTGRNAARNTKTWIVVLKDLERAEGSSQLRFLKKTNGLQDRKSEIDRVQWNRINSRSRDICRHMRLGSS